jgi:hypothetical protein
LKPRPISKVVWFARSMMLVQTGLTTCAAAYAREAKRLTGLKEVSAGLLEGSGATTNLFQSDTGAPCAIVVLDLSIPRSLPQLAGLLAHESTHIWQFAKEKMREAEPGREVEAYAVQWLVQEMMTQLYPPRGA